MKYPSVPLPVLLELVRFGLVGIVGFLANAVSVAVISRVTNLYLTGFVSWVIAATVTWFLNRIWTFSGQSDAPFLRQWIHFLGANSLGLVLYYPTYATAITVSPLCASQPVLAVAAGSLVGLAANFTLSRHLVFR